METVTNVYYRDGRFLAFIDLLSLLLFVEGRELFIALR